MYKSRYKRASSRIAKRNRTRKVFGLALKIILPVTLLILAVFILRSDFLMVKGFQIKGADTVGEENIKNSASGFASGTKLLLLPKSNILLLNKKELASALFSDFGRLEKVEVNKNFWDMTVEIKVEEREAEYLWCSRENECFFMTKNGFVFEPHSAQGSEGSKNAPRDKIIFRGVLIGDPLMKNFATPEKMGNYSGLILSLRKGGIETISIDIESADKAVAETNAGNLIFNPEESDTATVAENSILLMNDVKNKNPSARFDYLDARFGNKIFYKLK